MEVNGLYIRPRIEYGRARPKFREVRKTETNYWKRRPGNRVSRRSFLAGTGAGAAGLTATVLVGCGDDDKTATATGTKAPAGTGTPAAASATTPAQSGDLAEVSEAEREWLVEVCTLARASDEAQPAFPGARRSELSVEERRRRADVIWPLSAETHERFVADMDRIATPERGQKIHEAIRNLSERQVADLRRALNEIDEIFISASTIEANNDRFNQTRDSARRRVDNELRAEPALRRLYQSLPECAGTAASPTPK